MGSEAYPCKGAPHIQTSARQIPYHIIAARSVALAEMVKAIKTFGVSGYSFLDVGSGESELTLIPVMSGSPANFEW